MKTKTIALLVPMLLAATAARADAYDCFPGCDAEAGSTAVINVCESKAVRDAMQVKADVESKLAPVKELYEIATDPTGYAIRTVADKAGIKVPRLVGYAMDPKGSLKAEVMKRVRAEARKQVGLASECKAEIAAEAAPASTDAEVEL